MQRMKQIYCGRLRITVRLQKSFDSKLHLHLEDLLSVWVLWTYTGFMGTPLSWGIQQVRGPNFNLFWPPPPRTSLAILHTLYPLSRDPCRLSTDPHPVLFVKVVIECPLTGFSSTCHFWEWYCEKTWNKQHSFTLPLQTSFD